MVGLLRQAYQNMINQAKAAGKAREAAEYRDTSPSSKGGATPP